jgi:hypothetical protein
MKLKEHRIILNGNIHAYTEDLKSNRLVNTMIPYIKKSFQNLKINPSKKIILKEIVNLLFDSQDRRPFFHVEGTELPLCWNNPGDWNIAYIKYEWGHLWSKNQSPETYNSIKNIALYSARCNRHIQSSLNIEELMVYGGSLAQRISNVLTKRRFLFDSERWNDLVEQLAMTTDQPSQ